MDNVVVDRGSVMVAQSTAYTMLCLNEIFSKPLQELQREIIAETIEGIDEAYRNSAYRKKGYVINHSKDKNTFMSTCGEIKYERTYFESKETGVYIYLADKACGITKNMRKSEDVVTKAIKYVVDSRLIPTLTANKKRIMIKSLVILSHYLHLLNSYYN
ncbi:MAG: UPF0236 family protein [Vallitaleaceae bacterium]|jgi:hypothetical protein|nr:UPF0236 family protein [Vallitaleaceae bacterium]